MGDGARSAPQAFARRRRKISGQKVISLVFFATQIGCASACDPCNHSQTQSRATGACSLAILSHFSHFLLLPPRSGGHFCVSDISLVLNPHSQERSRVRNGATRQSASRWRLGVRQRVPFRRGAAAYASASFRSADENNSIYASGSGPGNFRWCRSCAHALPLMLSSTNRCFCKSDI